MGRNAINDILMGSRFQGAIESISWLTEILDSKFAQFITLIAFFIISAALLRNVIAGAYAAYPRFWDMIAAAKESVKEKKLNLGGTDVSWLARIGAFFIPDLKSLSDFNDDTVEAKHYFYKAIPKMFMVVAIGIFIYNGYYRDTVAITANFGSTMLERYILSADPVALVDRTFEGLSKPSFASEDIDTDEAKYTLNIATECYSKIITFYTDVKDKGTKTKLASEIEPQVQSFLAGNSEYLNAKKYKMSYSVDLVLEKPKLDGLTKKNGPTALLNTFGTSIRVRDLSFDTQQHQGEEWYLRIIIQYKKLIEKVEDVNSLQDLVLEVSSSNVRQTTDKKISTIKIDGAASFVSGGSYLSSATYGYGVSNYITVENGYPSEFKNGAENTIVFKTDKRPGYTTTQLIELATPLNYALEGKTHYIKYIKIVSDSNQYVYSKSNDTVKAKFGQGFPKQTAN